jgi:eukaryotic-like serine/threonine-protein kinase
MAKRLTCPAGHLWEVADEVPVSLAICPDCGGSAILHSLGASALTHGSPLGSWPNLGTLKPVNHDPGVTIPAEPKTMAHDTADFEVTIPPLSSLPEEISKSVPGYELLTELGRGGMGVVYKAMQLELDRMVALKMVLAGVHVSKRELERFRSEAAAVAGLQHINIVQVYEVGEHGGRPYFSLEYVEGGSLAHKLQGEPLPAREAAELIEVTARAMHFAHERGIVHRDLKPANILLTKEGKPKVTDFGLAKHIRGSGAHTQTGTVMGTPSYMAPEQAMGHSRDVGPAADVYALGAILYEMLSGRPPFRSETPLDTMMQVASEEPVPVGRLQPHLPPDLATVCMKCLQKEPYKRYASADELADDLARFRQGEPIQARPIGTVERAYKWARRRPGIAALLALTALAIAASFITVTLEWRHEAQARHSIEKAQRETAAALARAETSLYCNRIALAEREWLANNVGRVRQLLRECKPERRGWEWHYLHRLSHSDLITLRGHDSPIMGLSFSPDGQHLVSASTDQTVKVWDPLADRALFTQHAVESKDRGLAVTFSADSKQLLFAGAQNVVQTWDAFTGRPIQQSRRTGSKVYCAAFSPDRRRLAGGCLDGSVVLWELGTQKEMTFPGHTGMVHSVAFAGKFLASAGQDGTVKVWDTGNGSLVKSIPAHSAAVFYVAFTTDGWRVVSASADGTVKVWEAVSGKLIATFRGHHSLASCAVFSPSGKFIASAGKDDVIRIWNAATAEEVMTLRGHTDRIHCLAFRRDGKLLASAGDDRVIKIWDATSEQEAKTFRAGLTSNCIAFAPDGKHLATAEGYIEIWDPQATTKPVAKLRGEPELIRSLAYNPDGTKIATAGSALSIRDAATGRDLKILSRATPAHFRSVAYSRDGQRLVTGGDDGVVRIWDANNGKELFALTGHQGSVLSVVFSTDGKRIASASADRTIKIWDAPSGTEVRTLTGHTGRVNSVAFSPDGRWLASGAAGQTDADEDNVPEGELKVWDANTGELRHDLWGHSAVVNVVLFSPDGERLVSGSNDQTVKIWEPVFGHEVLTLRGHTGSVHGLTFSPDGHVLVSIGTDQAVRIWSAAPLQ